LNVNQVALSVISHGHMHQVFELLSSLNALPSAETITVYLTLNLPEEVEINKGIYNFDLIIIRNKFSKGFGENHNAAFAHSVEPFFCVCNPDILFEEDPFPALISQLSNDSIGVVAPIVRNRFKSIEDSARKKITPLRILLRFLNKKIPLDYPLEDFSPISVDWLAGMFLFFSRDSYRSVQGFDTAYYMYCEDADICYRIHLLGKKVIYDRSISVIHDARRESHKKVQYLIWHTVSLLRYFFRYAFR